MSYWSFHSRAFQFVLGATIRDESCDSGCAVKWIYDRSLILKIVVWTWHLHICKVLSSIFNYNPHKYTLCTIKQSMWPDLAPRCVLAVSRFRTWYPAHDHYNDSDPGSPSYRSLLTPINTSITGRFLISIMVFFLVEFLHHKIDGLICPFNFKMLLEAWIFYP